MYMLSPNPACSRTGACAGRRQTNRGTSLCSGKGWRRMNHQRHDHVVPTISALVGLSIVIAIFASSVAFTLASRMRSALDAGERRRWLLAGAVAMGFGIWSMHFTGMLAYDITMPVKYDVPDGRNLTRGGDRRGGSGAERHLPAGHLLAAPHPRRHVLWARVSARCTTSACSPCGWKPTPTTTCATSSSPWSSRSPSRLSPSGSRRRAWTTRSLPPVTWSRVRS